MFHYYYKFKTDEKKIPSLSSMEKPSSGTEMALKRRTGRGVTSLSIQETFRNPWKIKQKCPQMCRISIPDSNAAINALSSIGHQSLKCFGNGVVSPLRTLGASPSENFHMTCFLFSHPLRLKVTYPI